MDMRLYKWLEGLSLPLRCSTQSSAHFPLLVFTAASTYHLWKAATIQAWNIIIFIWMTDNNRHWVASTVATPALLMLFKFCWCSSKNRFCILFLNVFVLNFFAIFNQVKYVDRCERIHQKIFCLINQKKNNFWTKFLLQINLSKIFDTAASKLVNILIDNSCIEK